MTEITNTATPIGLKVSRCKTGTFDGYRLDVDDTGGPYALVGRKQDADLFAAAPDLLTALHGAQVAIHSEYCGRTCHAECLAVVAAIAKAEGRTS